MIFTGVQTGVPAVAASCAELGAAVLYLWGVRRLARRGRAWPERHSAAFLAGLVAVWIAVGSGLAGRDDSSVPLHVVQHVLLMMVAPPLLAMGRPLALVAQSGGRKLQVLNNRFLRSRPIRVLTHPLPAAVLYFATMWAMLVDPTVYDYLAGHEAAHQAGHALLLVAGLLYWAPLVAPDASVHRLGHPARVVLLLLSMPLEALPGVLLRFRSSPIDVLNSLAGTRTAGEVLLVAATGACSLWLVTVVVQWFAFALREERREGAREGATELGWTVPWWMEPAAGPATGPLAGTEGPVSGA